MILQPARLSLCTSDHCLYGLQKNLKGDIYYRRNVIDHVKKRTDTTVFMYSYTALLFGERKRKKCTSCNYNLKQNKADGV